MQQVETANAKPPQAQGAKAGLTLFRPDNPAIALGLAVSYLMTKPAFAALRFGEWSRILTGQINRKHFWFVVDERRQIQGFLGWAVTTKEKAEAWVEGRRALSAEDANEGDCIIFNAWASSAPGVNRVLLAASRRVMQGKDTVYFKRYYKDGTTRASRLLVNEFVDGHLAQTEA